MNCPACQQEVGDTGLGTPLPHSLPSSPEFCPGFIQAAQFSGPDPLPPPAAIKEPGRKVRSDKGTKRGQRKKGSDSYADAPNGRPAVQAAPGGPPSQEPERVAAKRKPRSAPPVYLVLPHGGAITVSYPSYSSHSEACDVAKVQAEETGVPCVVYEAQPLDRFEREVKRTRLGGVRRRQT